MKNKKTLIILAIVVVLGVVLFIQLKKKKEREALEQANASQPSTIGNTIMDLWGTIKGGSSGGSSGKQLTNCEGMTPEERAQIENSDNFICA